MQSSCIIIILGSCLWIRAEVFTAITHCELLIDTYKEVIVDLDEYVEREEKRVRILKKQLDMYKREHEKAIEDIHYVENPINSFTIVKRLTKDLDEIKKRANMNIESVQNTTMKLKNITYPDYEDLLGAAQAIIRLKDTYKLNVTELAEGKIHGVTYSLPMSASDCFALGTVLYNNGDYQNALPWLKEALLKYKADNIQEDFFTDFDIIDFISHSYYLRGNAQEAIKWANKLEDLDHKKISTLSNVTLYKEPISKDKLEDKKENKTSTIRTVADSRYPGMCRGEYDVPQEVSKRLTCFFLTKNHPFLRLAAVKTEQLYVNPDVFIFYDVMSDTEIEYVKNSTRHKLERAKVIDLKTLKAVRAKNRIGKTAGFPKGNYVARRISQRISDFTGLSMETAEALQVANYGIGGYQNLHYDFSQKHEKIFQDPEKGNRIATVVFYMSEVAKGGATAFPILGLSVFPIKNAALFWMNLHPSGEGDLSTIHGACPVLLGSKWASVKWIHVGGQEFKRPCSLTYQEEKIDLQQYPISFRN